MVRGPKRDKKAFYGYTNWNRKVQEDKPFPLLVSNTSRLVTMGKEKTEVLSNFYFFFHLVFTSNYFTHRP